MFRRAYRRSPWRRYGRISLIVLSVIALLDLFAILNKYKTFQQNLSIATVTSPDRLPSIVRDQKILICAQFWTSAHVLSSHWNDDLVKLIKVLGTDNIYLSIYESGSLDNTKEVLQLLDEELDRLKVKKRVIIDPSTHADEVSKPYNEDTPGRIHTPRSGEEKELRRIPYLANLRNKVLEPLHDGSAGMAFDKVLFLNDVHFTPSDVLTLLGTRGGYYSVACAMDYMLPPRYYDTFVLRDDQGLESATETFPYFRSTTARHGITSGNPIQVKSCWNGMLVMDATPFMPSSDSSDVLRFRGVDDSLAVKHVEGSECCLVHADLAAMGAAGAGIWVNPAVRVGYSKGAWETVHDQPGSGWMSPTDYVFGIYHNRLVRWTRSNWLIQRRINKQVTLWKEEGIRNGQERSEPGEMCLIDEMQVIIWNGWAHV